MKATTRNSTVATTAQTGYEAKVITEALNRVKGNPQIKGTIHEILFRDTLNANPLRLAQGETAHLVPDTTAKTVDLVVMKGGKVVERFQLKDCTSPSAVRDVITKINNGQYRSAQVVGTPETVEKLARHADKLNGTKEVTSTRISSEYTEQLGRRAGAPASPGAGSVTTGLGNACKSAAKSGGMVGGVAGAGIAAVTGAIDLVNGEKELGEVAKDVAKGGTVGAASGAAASAAATATGAVAGATIASGVAAVGLTGAAATVAVAAAPLAVAVGVGYVVSEVCSSLWDALFD